MTIKEKKIIREEIKKIYVANDGTEFVDMDECTKYDKSAECAIRSAVTSITVNEKYWELADPYRMVCDDTLHVIEIKDENDLKVLNQWVSLYHNSCWGYAFGADAIGTTQIVATYDEYMQIIGTPEKMKADFCKMVDEICGIKEGENA